MTVRPGGPKLAGGQRACSWCRAPIIMACVRTKAGRLSPMPVDPQPVANGNLVRIGTPAGAREEAEARGARDMMLVVRAGSGRWQSHFASCPKADRARKPRSDTTPATPTIP